VEQGVLEGVLWDVVSPFAHVARVDAVLGGSSQFIPIANDR
jgi:hypothetical protein